jgi:adenylate cyclase
VEKACFGVITLTNVVILLIISPLKQFFRKIERRLLVVRLVIQLFDGRQEILPISEAETFIGRNDPASDLVNQVNLPDSTVSRRHAKIVLDNHIFYIEDLQSVNRTMVNGKEVKKAKLVPGDKISIGRNTILFESEGTRTINPADFMIPEPHIDPRRTIDSNYYILQQLSKLLITKVNVKDFLQAVIDMVLEGTKAKKGVLILTDSTGKPKQVVASGGQVFFSEDVVQQVMAQKKSILVGHDFEASGTMIQRGIYSAICAPLLKEPQLMGVIYLEDSLPGKFGEEELIVLTLFANQLATGIENANLNENLLKEIKIRSNLERFLSPQVVDLVTKDCLDKDDIFLKTDRVVATILFSDIQGFTLLSERLDPQEVMGLLNQHFSLMTEVIFAYQGTLDKYVGDGLVAIFGAPLPHADHAARAIQAGLEMQRRHQDYLNTLPLDKRFNIRIGINTGEVVAGYMGAPKRMEYTVLGETVIVAQRLQALADPGTVYMGKSTHEAVKQNFPAEFVARMPTPKGEKEIEIYRLAK